MRVALYARVSTGEQSPEPQMERLIAWAALNGHEITHEAREVASGKLVRRPEAERVMNLARGHHVHGIAVVKVDRWARSIQHLAATVRELHDLGVAFVAVDQGLSVRKGDATGGLILNVLGAVAEWEGAIISERTRDGIAGKPGRGRHRSDCGVAVACPTGKHQKKGMRGDREDERPKSPSSPNDRLLTDSHGRVDASKVGPRHMRGKVGEPAPPQGGTVSTQGDGA